MTDWPVLIPPGAKRRTVPMWRSSGDGSGRTTGSSRHSNAAAAPIVAVHAHGLSTVVRDLDHPDPACGGHTRAPVRSRDVRGEPATEGRHPGSPHAIHRRARERHARAKPVSNLPARRRIRRRPDRHAVQTRRRIGANAAENPSHCDSNPYPGE